MRSWEGGDCSLCGFKLFWRLSRRAAVGYWANVGDIIFHCGTDRLCLQYPLTLLTFDQLIAIKRVTRRLLVWAERPIAIVRAPWSHRNTTSEAKGKHGVAALYGLFIKLTKAG